MEILRIEQLEKELYGKAMDSVFKSTSELVKTIYANAICNTIEKILHYHEKISRATFITKWYWKRRLQIIETNLEELIKMPLPTEKYS